MSLLLSLPSVDHPQNTYMLQLWFEALTNSKTGPIICRALCKMKCGVFCLKAMENFQMVTEH